MRKIAGLAISVVALAAAMAVPAKAGTYTYNGFNVVGDVAVTITNPISETVGAGQIVLHGSGADAGNNLSVWCFDLLDHLQNGPYTYQIDQLTTAGVGQGNPVLASNQIIAIGDLIEHGLGIDPSNPLRFAALQVAIWKTIYGAALSLSGESVAMSNEVNTFLADAAPSGSIFDPNVKVFFLHDAPDAPNQVLGFAVQQTPLPAAAWLFGTGLAGLGMLARRQRRKQRSQHLQLA